MLFVGVDWAEAHNDVLVMDAAGTVLGRARCGVGVRAGSTARAGGRSRRGSEQVMIGIEIDRGLLVDSLVGAGYRVYAINPLAASRYRDRHWCCPALTDTGFQAAAPILS